MSDVNEITISPENSINELDFPDIPKQPTHIVKIVPIIKEPKRNFSDITVFSMKFNIKSEHLPRLQEDDYLKYVVRKYFQSQNNVCILYYNKVRRMIKEPLVKILAYCAHYSCSTFRIVVNISTGETIVHQSKKDFQHCSDVKLTAQIRGIERKILRSKLKYVTAANMRAKQIIAAPEKLIDVGQLNQIIRCPPQSTL